ncbi:hypothetical protein Cni_G11164 [Canna indica]|uniref:TF-B3 domain-containing protein n=1 Tax=Canna indica TaxID=4628 RepID=A0AAQ3QBF2_9LILI|nr:hypothetical protein Cni_G11164 [Canna indica]
MEKGRQKVMAGMKKKKKKPVCDDCPKQWSQGKKLSSPSSPPPPRSSNPPSFFKIMIGGFRDVLFIPPRFAGKLVDLVNQNVYLEDCHGNSTKVVLSRIDGSLAFQKGWHDFVVDYSIGLGELLVFKYVRKSLFLVNIFSTDACERVSFDGSNLTSESIPVADLSLEELQSPKRYKIFEAPKDEYSASKKDPKTKAGASSSGSKIREGDHVANGAVACAKGKKFTQDHYDSGSPHILDVIDITGSPNINAEEPKEKGNFIVEQAKADVVNKTSLYNQKKFKAEFYSDNVARFCLEEHLASHENGHGKPHTSSAVSSIRSELKHRIACRLKNIPYNNKLDLSAGNNSGSSSTKDFSPFLGSTPQDVPAKDTMEENTCQSACMNTLGILPEPLQEEDEKNATLCSSQTLKVVKVEAKDLDDPILPNSLCFRLTLPSNEQCWLKLPETLPSRKGQKKKERKIVILQDPSLRLWPVMYHECSNFTGFVGGWKDFAIANNLKQGDQCEFLDADTELAILQVQISRR